MQKAYSKSVQETKATVLNDMENNRNIELETIALGCVLILFFNFPNDTFYFFFNKGPEGLTSKKIRAPQKNSGLSKK